MRSLIDKLILETHKAYVDMTTVVVSHDVPMRLCVTQIVR